MKPVSVSFLSWATQLTTFKPFLSKSISSTLINTTRITNMERPTARNGLPTLSALLEKIISWKNDSDKILEFIAPEKLEGQMQMKMLRPNSKKEIEECVDFLLKYSVDTSHPLFLNQLYGAAHPAGLAASYIIEKMNTNAHTYEVAPIFVVAERIVLRELRRLFFGSFDGDGIFSPGGSMSNMYGFTLARHMKFPDVKNKGLFGLPPLVIYTSEDAHYSVSKAANWMGFGQENVVKVKTNKKGEMIPSELEEAIKRTKEEGKVPLVVNATAGTTVLGAFDDLIAISEICKREELWLHCDAAWGGSFIFSEKLRIKWLDGIDQCDSIAWNAHKMLGAPLQCSVFITKHKDSLMPCNSLNASYLFQPDKYYSIEYDRCGDKGFQCGRKCDGFKLWFMWASIGFDGFRKLVEGAEECAGYITQEIKSRPDFILYLDEHQCTNVFFWHIPPRLRNKEKTEDWWKEIAAATVKIKERMVLDGSMMVGYSPLPHKNIPNAIRLVIPANPPKTHDHMDFVLDNITNLARDL